MLISDWSSDVCSSDLLGGISGSTRTMWNMGRFSSRRRIGTCQHDRGDVRGPAGAQHLRRREQGGAAGRTEGRRVGQECGSTCRYEWSLEHYKIKITRTLVNNKLSIHQNN